MWRLISWNTLADAYVRPAFYPRSDPALLRRNARAAAIIEWIATSNADVVCLQEAEPALVDAARLAHPDWEVHYASKVGKPDGCAIIARHGVVIDDVRTIAYADGAPDREDSGHVALFASAEIAGKRVGIATTHLRWDPPGTSAESRWAVREVTELLRATREGSSIVCGDLNVEPDDPVYAMLAQAFVDPAAGVLRPTANPNGRAKRIDHILHTRDLVAEALPIDAIDDTTPLPSWSMPSDHVPIGVLVR